LLTLYGQPGSSYMTQWKTNLSGSLHWQNGWLAPLTNEAATFSGFGTNGPVLYYRAYPTPEQSSA